MNPFRLIRRVLRSNLDSRIDKLVLIALADCCDSEFRCNPTIDQLSERTCRSRAHVMRHLKAMEDFGAISRKRGYKGRATAYQLHPDAIFKKVMPQEWSQDETIDDPLWSQDETINSLTVRHQEIQGEIQDNIREEETDWEWSQGETIDRRRNGESPLARLAIDTLNWNFNK